MTQIFQKRRGALKTASNFMVSTFGFEEALKEGRGILDRKRHSDRINVNKKENMLWGLGPLLAGMLNIAPVLFLNFNASTNIFLRLGCYQFYFLQPGCY